jgi:hypothetical protein
MRCFVCGTNRHNIGVGGRSLEDLMQSSNCAAMWEYPNESGEIVKYVSHMERVEIGDLIFMFSSGCGIVGVGKAKEACFGPLLPGAHQRLRGDTYNAAEWQVPVEWLHWNAESVPSFKAWNATFYELSDPVWSERRDELLAHFKLNESP